MRLWGEPRAGQAPLVMVHGWMDVARFLPVRGRCLRQRPLRHRARLARLRPHRASHTDNYWFPDYLADLDFLLDHYAPRTPVDLVGHSMGGNIAMLYAGAPQRIRALVNLEGFGMPATPAGAGAGALREVDGTAARPTTAARWT